MSVEQNSNRSKTELVLEHQSFSSLAIEAKGLSFSYTLDSSPVNILKDFSIKVQKGDFVAIQGPSGSGKSTLLYLLGLLSQPSSGDIKILGQNALFLDEDERARLRNKSIGFVFQQFHLLPKTTILENILLPTRYSYHEKVNSPDSLKLRAIEFAQFVGLSGKLDKFPNQLSGGQQQRAAICRALMNDPEILLADEPTGNLDSSTAEQIMNLFHDLNSQYGKTIVIITHDDEIAKKCHRILRIKDGKLVKEDAFKKINHSMVTDLSSQFPLINHQIDINSSNNPEKKNNTNRWSVYLKQFSDLIKDSIPSAFWNLKRHRARTTLTMVGIAVGVAAVLAMVTLGQFTKERILSGYAQMGVNTLVFNGIPNWELKATDLVPAPFRFFDWDTDLSHLDRVFPEIKRISPFLDSPNVSVNCGGRTIDQETKVVGVNEEGLNILQRKNLFGRNFSHVEMEQRSPVCIIGYNIAERLFFDTQPMGQVLRIAEGESSYSCRVIGVLEKTSSNRESSKPNEQIFVPFTFFQAQSANWWSSQLKQVLIQLKSRTDTEKVGRGIKFFFEQKYGPSGKFTVDTDSVLVAQLKQFLTLFTILLSSVAFVTLAVGGIGITNMMLVSISERLKEIGLRKALGATRQEIRIQFLLESMIVCSIAGILGILIGFFTYHLAIWATSHFLNRFEFTWTIDGFALLLSILSIIIVGLLSGIFPALRAEKLQVIEALRVD